MLADWFAKLWLIQHPSGSTPKEDSVSLGNEQNKCTSETFLGSDKSPDC